MKKLTNTEWVSRMHEIYGDKYGYEKCEYGGSHSRVTITCWKHGDFTTEAGQFAKGCGCKECAKEGRIKKKRDDFTKEARKKHGDKYQYRFDDKGPIVTVICPKHGESKQNMYAHLSGCGCKECYHESRLNSQKDQKELTRLWVEKVKRVHGDKYDYTKSIYTRAKDDIIVTCPLHGDFTLTADEHLSGRGCRKCAMASSREKQLLTKDTVVKRAIEIHGYKYEYIGEYNGMNANMDILCPIHGIFTITPANHIYNKQGCPECGKAQCVKSNTMTTDEFIRRCKEVHGDEYDYSSTTYNGWGNNFSYVCHKKYADGTEHGIVTQKPAVHLLHKCGCPICGRTVSKAEKEIASIVGSYVPIVENDRSVLPSKRELDIYIPSMKLAIEYNGMRWHSEQNITDKNYHLSKLNECNSCGVRLIQIFEWEYLHKHEIVLSKIRHMLNADNGLCKIYARKCSVKEIDSKVSSDFLDRNHIQGHCNATVHLGCFDCNGVLSGVMSFILRDKLNMRWELLRFATDINKVSCGVGGKLFSYFIKNYNFEKITSFADRRWTVDINNNLYIKLGFKVESIIRADYRYTKTPDDYIHKFNFRKRVLSKKYGLPLTMTETEMAKELGYYRIWNCGLLKYTYQ